MGGEARAEMPYGWGRVPYGYDARLPWMNLPFPIEEYEERLARLRRSMDAEAFDGLVVLGNWGDNSDVRYLSNFEDFYGGESVVVVPLDGAPGFATDAVMHGEPMHSGIQDCWMRDVRCAAAPRTVTGDASAATVYDHVADILRDRGVGDGRIGVVGAFDTARLREFLVRSFPRAEVREATPLLRRMRAIKSPREVDLLRRACRLADAAMEAAMKAVRPGITEHELAAEANYAMFRAGAEHPAFPIALAAGSRSGYKHMPPTDYEVREGDVVYIDVGGRYRGYCSDGSRQRVCGDPTPGQLDFMETQIRIVEEVMGLARPGSVIAELAEVGVAIAREAGYEEYLYFRGHGIGCAPHDLPAITPGNPAVLEEDMVFCFEPMLVKEGFGTACREDTWWVTSEGVECLNTCPYRWW